MNEAYQLSTLICAKLSSCSIAEFFQSNFPCFYAIESIHMFFMLSKCRHIYVVMHTRILGGGACVTMTQMKTKISSKVLIRYKGLCS